MRRIALLFALLLGGLASAQSLDFRLADDFSLADAVASNETDGILGSYLDTTFAGQTAGDPCSQFASELVAPSFCLRGDATQVSSSGMSLSAIGSPTTQTMAWCGNGLSCASVSRQLLLSGTNYYQTVSTAAPSSSFWACARGINDAPMSLGRYIAQGSVWGLRVSATGQLFFDVGGGTAVSTSTGAIIGGASQLVCVWWHQVGAGSNVATLYLDGVQVGQNSAEPNLSGAATQINIGGNAAVTRVGFAIWSSGDLPTNLPARLAAATAPMPAGTRGEALTFSRNSLASCPAPDGSITWLQPGRPCVSGGLRARPATTNLHIFTEQLGNAAFTQSNVAVTSDATTAPDGSKTADLIVPSVTSVAHEIWQGHNVTSGTTYTESRFLKTSGWRYVQFLGNSGDFGDWWTNFDLQTCTVTQNNAGTSTVPTVVVTASAQGFCRVAISHAAIATDAAAGGRITLAFVTSATSARFPAVAGDGTSGVYDWGEQFETGSIASDYCRSESTSATCASETASVPMPNGASVNEGCAKFCITPNWTGANPLATSIRILSGRASDGAAQFSTLGGSSASVNAFDGTHTPSVAGALTAGAKSCFVTKWSKSGNALSVTNTSTGTAGAASAFSGFSAFDAALAIGTQSGGNQPNAATISDIRLGSNPYACQ
jgi:hypothetical protein